MLQILYYFVFGYPSLTKTQRQSGYFVAKTKSQYDKWKYELFALDVVIFLMLLIKFFN